MAYKRLKYEEVKTILDGLASGTAPRQIGQLVKRPSSAISSVRWFYSKFLSNPTYAKDYNSKLFSVMTQYVREGKTNGLSTQTVSKMDQLGKELDNAYITLRETIVKFTQEMVNVKTVERLKEMETELNSLRKYKRDREDSSLYRKIYGQVQ